MIKHIKGSTFAIYLAYRLVDYPDCVIKSIGTNQTHFIIRVETPDVTRFCLETADIVKAKVDELSPDDKFVLLNMLDNFLHKIRVDVAHEYVLCENCKTYIRRDDRKVVEKANCIEHYCPLCGKLHRWEVK